MKRVPIILGLMVLASMAWGQLMFQPGHVAGLASSGFTPSSLSGLVLWMDSENNVTLNGTRVSIWGDRSASAFSFKQGTAANQFLFTNNVVNGKPALYCDLNKFLTNNGCTLSSITNKTVFYVTRSGEETFAAAWGFGLDNIGFKNTYVALGGLNGNYNMNITAHHYWSGDSTNMVWKVVWHKEDFGLGANQLKCGTNLDQVAQFNDAGETVASAQAIVGNDGTGSNTYNLWLAEIIMYDRALSGSEFTNVVQYLQARWGL